MWVHGSKSQAHLNINNALSESIMFLLLYANAGKLCVVCETGRWYSSSLWPCHAVTVSGVESPSILLPWACLWVEAVPARHQIKPPPHLLYFTVFFFVMYLLSICLPLSFPSLPPSPCLCAFLPVFLRLLQRAWCLHLWRRECLFTKMSPHLMQTHLHNNNPIWSISDSVFDASNEAIMPDKMLSALVYQIKRHMGSHSLIFFQLKINLSTSQIVQNQFLCISRCLCKHELPFFPLHLSDGSFLAARHSVRKRHQMTPDYQ